LKNTSEKKVSCFTNAAFKISRANPAASPTAGNGVNLNASLSSFKVCPLITAASSTVFMISQFAGFLMRKLIIIRPCVERILVEERKAETVSLKTHRRWTVQ